MLVTIKRRFQIIGPITAVAWLVAGTVSAQATGADALTTEDLGQMLAACGIDEPVGDPSDFLAQTLILLEKACRKDPQSPDTKLCRYFYQVCRGWASVQRFDAIKDRANIGQNVDTPDLSQQAVYHSALAYFRFERSLPAAMLLAEAFRRKLEPWNAVHVFEDFARNEQRKNYEILVFAGDSWRRSADLKPQEDVTPRQERALARLARLAQKQATDAYRTATRYRPLEEKAWQRYLDHRQPEPGKLIEEGDLLLLGQPAMAARAAERALAIPGPPAAKRAERAFVLWARAKALTGELSLGELDRLVVSSASLPAEASSALRQLLEEPTTAPLDEWLPTDRQKLAVPWRLAILRVLQDLASQKLRMGHATTATAILERALAPWPAAAEGEAADFELLMTRLDLWRALGEAHAGSDDRSQVARSVVAVIDPLIREGERLTDQPWVRARYLETAGHLVLQMAARWSKAGWPDPPPLATARGVAWLEASLAASDSIEDGEPGFETPRPSLHETLASSYQNQPQSDTEKAIAHRLRAAMDFLDLDALRPAREALDLAAELDGKTEIWKALDQMTAHRRRLDLASSFEDVGDLYSLDEGLPTCEIPMPQLLEEQEPSFVARLRFKIAADLGAKLDRLGEEMRNLDFRRDALACHLAAIDSLQQLSSLPSSDDVERIERSARAVAMHATPRIFFERSLDFKSHFGLFATIAGEKVLQLPSSVGPSGSELRISRDVFAVAEIRRALADIELEHPYHIGIQKSLAWLFPGCNTKEQIKPVKRIFNKQLDYLSTSLVKGLGFRVGVSYLLESESVSRAEICAAPLPMPENLP